MTKRQRLDLLLLQRGLAASREQAQQLIRAGWVRQAGRVLDKPGTALPTDAPLEVAARPRFVSRGGEKLEAALTAFPIIVSGRVCLDGGLSTGGFSDCLLQHGAQRVYGIDVGYGQVAWSLRTDPRMVLRERTNLRHLTPEELYGPEDPWPDLAVADLSFISLTHVIPALRATAPDADFVLLIKPQFEVGRTGVREGIVTNPALREDAIRTVLWSAFDAGLGEPCLLDRVAYAGGQGLGLAVGGARCHDHPFKQRRQMLGVEDLDVLRLHVFQAINDGALEFGNVFFGRGFRFGGCGHQAVK